MSVWGEALLALKYEENHRQWSGNMRSTVNIENYGQEMDKCNTKIQRNKDYKQFEQNGELSHKMIFVH